MTTRRIGIILAASMFVTLGAAMLLHGTNFLAKRMEVEADGTTTDD